MSNLITLRNPENSDSSENSLYEKLKSCANYHSTDSLIDGYSHLAAISLDHRQEHLCDYYKMISANSVCCDDTFGDHMLEDNGRISLAYENLKTIPKRIAEKFAAHTKFLDLSHNNFQNLSFLTYFEGLHTLILDRNNKLDVNSLPFLPSLKILWINNCEIMNIADWIHRIQAQCPALEHLSMMGNHGSRTLFNYYALTSKIKAGLTLPTSTSSDYREYVFDILPNLMFLDGTPRYPSAQLSMTVIHPNSSQKNYCTSPSVIKGNGNATPKDIVLLTDNSLNHTNNNNSTSESRKALSINLRELFRLRRRRKSYQSSSTN